MQHLFSIDRVLYIHDLYEDGVCFTLSRRNLQVAGFFAGAAPCISPEKKKKIDFTSSELVLPNRYTPHCWLAARLPGAAEEGSSRACRGCRQAAAAAARPLPSASPLRRHLGSAAGQRCPAPRVTAGRSSGPDGAPTGRPAAAAAGRTGLRQPWPVRGETRGFERSGRAGLGKPAPGVAPLPTLPGPPSAAAGTPPG